MQKLAAMKRQTLAEHVLARINHLVEQHDVTYDVLAPHLGVGASAVSKILNGKNSLSLDHIERLCEFFQLSPAEICADPYAVIQAISPLEAQLLTHFRAMTELERHGLLTVLDRPGTATDKRRRPRMGHPELTSEQQLLVDLYQRSGPQEREGVLKVLKGTAKKRDGDRAGSRDTSE